MKLKPLIWVGSSRYDLSDFPRAVKQRMGHALCLAQNGKQHVHAKVLKGFAGAGVAEIIENDTAGTFRTVYTVKMHKVIFVLHAFQKKSKHGMKTPQQEIDLIKKRLKEAQEIYKELENGKEI